MTGPTGRYIESEVLRARTQYRPQRIRVLFVGESPPSKGKFFYCGSNNLLRRMRTAVGGPKEDAEFLNNFMARGWYLDDLVPEPIDDLPKPDREKRCRDARADFAARIAEYKPCGIVCLLLQIKHDVECAALLAKSKARIYAVHFHRHQTRFKEDMKRILPELEALP
jgi:hypothetical protein